MQAGTKAVTAAILLALAGHAAATDAPVVERARTLLRAPAAAVASTSRDGFRSLAVHVDADGTEHVRFARTYAGLPVIGGDVVVHSRNGALRSTDATLRQPLALDVLPTLTRSDAIVAAGIAFGARFTGAPEAELVVFARHGGPARLAWKVRLQDAQRDDTTLVDAHTGKRLDHWSNVQTTAATGTARTLFAGDVAITTNTVPTGGYELKDTTRGNQFTLDASNSRTSGQIYKDADNTWGDHTVADKATTAVDAQYGAAVTWDYYLDVHGRHGIADDGKGAASRVHYGFRYNNASWNDRCFCMTYGDGDGVNVAPLVALDIAGHEMSHGVTSHSAGLIYSGESGGLNEATSDILGTMVEFHANNAVDTPDYLLGEQVFIGNVPGSPTQHALRYMFDPHADGLSPNCYVPTLGDLDVHYSSGVANRFFYLLAEGSTPRTFSGVRHWAPTCNGGNFAGIGRAKAEKIWYRALTVYFTSDTGYAGARAATLAAARDLFGPNSVEGRAVATAWRAVNVN